MNPSPTEVLEQWLMNANRDVPPMVMRSLLQLEKTSKRKPDSTSVTDLVGTWQLIFIGGKQSLAAMERKRQGPRKALPRWLNIQLTYHQQNHDSTTDSTTTSDQPVGGITNRVHLGLLDLTLTGPWRYYPKTQIMAFDFLFLTLKLSGRSLLSIPIRGGKDTEANFWDQPLKEQAFFRYFWVTPEAIAARGKGGGLALWRRVADSSREQD